MWCVLMLPPHSCTSGTRLCLQPSDTFSVRSMSCYKDTQHISTGHQQNTNSRVTVSYTLPLLLCNNYYVSMYNPLLSACAAIVRQTILSMQLSSQPRYSIHAQITDMHCRLTLLVIDFLFWYSRLVSLLSTRRKPPLTTKKISVLVALLVSCEF